MNDANNLWSCVVDARESKRVREVLDKVYSKEQSGIDEAISRMQFISLQKIVSY